MSVEGETRRWLRVSLQSVVVCMCACEPVLQVIAHDAVLLWPDGPERASKSTKKNCCSTRLVHDVLLRVQHLVYGRYPADAAGEPELRPWVTPLTAATAVDASIHPSPPFL